MNNKRIDAIQKRIREINRICINRLFSPKYLDEERNNLKKELERLTNKGINKKWTK